MATPAIPYALFCRTSDITMEKDQKWSGPVLAQISLLPLAPVLAEPLASRNPE